MSQAIKSKVNLEVTNEEFFKVHYLKAMTPASLLACRLADGAEIYSHDELHQLLALSSGSPIYKTMKYVCTTHHPG